MQDAMGRTKEMTMSVARLNRKLFPTGLNPPSLPPEWHCRILVQLDVWEQQPKPVFVYDGTPLPEHEAKARQLVESLESLAELRPRLGKRRPHRHSPR